MTTLFFYHSFYTHVWKNNNKPSPVSVGLNLVSCFPSWVLTRLSSCPSTVYRYSMHRTIHFFQIHSHLITHVRKWTLNKASFILVKLKQKSNNAKFWQVRNLFLNDLFVLALFLILALSGLPITAELDCYRCSESRARSSDGGEQVKSYAGKNRGENRGHWCE